MLLHAFVYLHFGSAVNLCTFAEYKHLQTLTHLHSSLADCSMLGGFAGYRVTYARLALLYFGVEKAVSPQFCKRKNGITKTYHNLASQLVLVVRQN